MLVPKEIIRPGTYYYVDQDSGLPKKLTVTPENIQHFHDSGNRMLAAGLSVPVPIEHQADARPLTAGEKAAKQLLHNAGWVKGYTVKDGALFGTLDIQDEEVAKKLPRTIRWTSPWINSFVDGDGRSWDGVISHVALTSRPRITCQQPFPTLGAAMSFAATMANQPFTPRSIAKGKGVLLSRAGLLATTGAGAFKPVYPVAFSLWAGATLASDEMPKEKPPEKKKPPPPPGEKPAEKPTTEGGGDGEPSNPVPNPDEPLPVQALEEALIDADGDISVYEVLVDLLESVGVPLPEGTTKENFAERLYEAAMEKVKGMSQKAQTPEPPMAEVKPADKPNPIMQEQPPAYMSLEAVERIADPQLKQLARVALSLQANAIEAAKGRRMDRIERLVKRVRQDGFRDKLIHQAASCQLSLGMDGKVNDPMTATLDILEAGIRDLPTLLTSPAAMLSEQAHPAEYDGQMSEERRREVANEFLKNTHHTPLEKVAS